MGGPDSQYPVENSTETAYHCGYRKAVKKQSMSSRGQENIISHNLHFSHKYFNLMVLDAWFYKCICFYWFILFSRKVN